jgi:hypothetical protein
VAPKGVLQVFCFGKTVMLESGVGYVAVNRRTVDNYEERRVV